MLVDDANPLVVDTGVAPDSQCAAAPNNTWPFQLIQLAPILPTGWALLGDLQRVVALSPQRFLARAGGPAPAAADSDALDPAELSGGGGGGELEFRVIGAPGERVEVTVVSPATAPGAAASRALAGTVLVLSVEIPAIGEADVSCSAGACAVVPPSLSAATAAAAAAAAAAATEGRFSPRAAAAPTMGCSDGSCEGFCDEATVAACNATWASPLSLRTPRSSGNAPCGGPAPCASPADACAAGWSPCLGYGTAGGSAAALTSALSAGECAGGAAGAYVAAMSSARRAPCPEAPPSCDMGCDTNAYGAEPVCCGARCQVPSCAGGVWPAPGTRIMLGAGADHRTCADMAGGFVDGVLCCADAGESRFFLRR